MKAITLGGVTLLLFSTVLLGSGTTGDIVEFRLQGGWIQADLSKFVLDGSPEPALGDPMPYVTPDGIARIVYRGIDNHIHELRLQGGWIQADLFPFVTNGSPVPAAGDPFPYVTPDGIARIVYIANDLNVHELRLQGGWIEENLSALAGVRKIQGQGNAFAYVAPDNIPRVLYRGGVDSHIHELRLQGSWVATDLSNALLDPPPILAAGNPSAYFIQADGIPRLVFRSAGP